MGKVRERIGEQHSAEKAQDMASPDAKLGDSTVRLASAAKETRDAEIG